MPGTASERGLLDPFDPVAALPKSAEFLEELHIRFGNLGLAAAAYNAGPRRLQDWLDGRGSLPAETRNYVMTITGRTADEWAAAATRRQGARPAHLLRGAHDVVESAAVAFHRRARATRAGRRRAAVGRRACCRLRARAGARGLCRSRSLSHVLENRDPIIIERKFLSRGTQAFYQVRIGMDTRAGADEVCTALRRAGGACLVLRNQPTGEGPADGRQGRRAAEEATRRR